MDATVSAANNLTATWAGRHGGGSTVLSGVGLWVLLAALEGGAAGQARAELEAAVGVAPNDALAAVTDVVRLADVSVAVRAALAVWALARVPLEPDWVRALPAGLVRVLTGDTGVDRAAMDSWVDAMTDGELHTMPVTLEADTLLVLASALTVRTKWATPFTPIPAPAPQGAWAGLDAVQLVRTTGDLHDVRVVDTPAGSITMTRVMGADDVDVHLALGVDHASPGPVLEAALRALHVPTAVHGEALADGAPGPGLDVTAIDAMAPGDQLVLRTVAFAVDGRHDLLAHPADFGLAAAMTVRPGHFPGISAVPLAVGEARQDVTARFTHEGFVAAAVTAIGMRAGAAPPQRTHRVRRVTVTIDRPFGFAAVHRPSGLVLVAGWIDQPVTPST